MAKHKVRRPRVAAIGLDKIQEESIAPLCGTLRSVDSLSNYLKIYDWSETDVTVAGTNGAHVIAIEPVPFRGHLLAIGGALVSSWLGYSELRNSWCSLLVDFGNVERELSIAEACPDRYRYLASDLARQLNRLADPPRTIAAEMITDNRTLISKRAVTAKRVSSRLHLDENALIETTSGRPIALRCVVQPTLDASQEKTAVGLVLPEEADLSAWFRAFLGDVHELDRGRVPRPPPRIVNPSVWYTPEETALAERIAGIRSDIDRLREERNRAETELAAATERADTGKRRCIWADGSDLVEAVKEILEELGFAVRDMDARDRAGSTQTRRPAPHDPRPQRMGGHSRSQGLSRGYQDKRRTSNPRVPRPLHQRNRPRS